ncbi:NAD kinase [Carboxylicivirga caseinilyticus]|uniref:NAD kinase n=1 Tax=Carboxylicivirga caseinilyticus TaxID=3417572 RepID=UPI003D33246A|nr:NAD kinase [Marinilabiliaceae bacterium A049]
MKIAVFGKKFNKSFYDSCIRLFEVLRSNDVELFIYKPFYEFLLTEVNMKPDVVGFFDGSSGLPAVDQVFSIGGDGTFLEAVSFVRDSGVPIVGINSGRLGFLADVSQNEMECTIQDVLNGKYKVHQLDLLTLQTDNQLFKDNPYALNELSIVKRDSSSMITIHTYINDEFVNSYWADGLIIATSTGSTAYSLSVGGPIIHPDADNFVITPIAPHNLTVRPMVVPNNVEITLKVEGRDTKFLAALDSRSQVFEDSVHLKIKKADFSINVIKLPDYSFFTTLRNKLMWGLDRRN